MKLPSALFGACVLILGASWARAEVVYSVAERQPPAGHREGLQIVAIANSGAAIGGTSDSFHGFYWTNPTQVNALASLGQSRPADGSLPTGINNIDGACGYGYTSAGLTRGLHWQKPTGAPVVLQPIGSKTALYVVAGCTALNDSNVLVGDSSIGRKFEPTHATEWTGNEIIDLGALGDSTASSAALAISPNGLVAGASGLSAHGATHAVVWFYRSITDLGTLGGSDSAAVGINDFAQAVGSSDIAQVDPDGAPLQHAFLWQGGTMSDLGVLPGNNASHANAINRWGEIVGRSGINFDQNYHAVIWLKGIMTDLNQLLAGKLPSTVVLLNAPSIADSGRFEVAGENIATGERVSYLVTPTYSTSVSVTSTPNPSSEGQWVIFQASVTTTDAHGTPTGSVTFADGATKLKTVNLNSYGNALYATSTLGLGIHRITATYNQNDVYGAGRSTVVNQRVNLELIPLPHSNGR